MHHLNRIASKELVIGLPKLKFEKDKVCESCKRESKQKVLLNRKTLFQQLDLLNVSHGLVQEP